MVNDDASIANLKRQQQEQHQQQKAAKKKQKEMESNPDNYINCLDSGYASSTTRSCGSMSSATTGMMAMSSNANGSSLSPSSIASSSSSFMSHHYMQPTRSTNDMLAVAAALSGVADAETFDMTEDSMLSSSSIYEDFDRSIQSKFLGVCFDYFYSMFFSNFHR